MVESLSTPVRYATGYFFTLPTLKKTKRVASSRNNEDAQTNNGPA